MGLVLTWCQTVGAGIALKFEVIACAKASLAELTE